MPFKNVDRQRAAIRESKRKRRAAIVAIACKSGLPEPKVNPSGPTLPPDSIPRPLQTAEDARRCLAGQVLSLETDTRLDKIMKARCIGGLVNVFLGCLEKSDFEGRLTAIETRLEGTNGNVCEEA